MYHIMEYLGSLFSPLLQLLNQEANEDNVVANEDNSTVVANEDNSTVVANEDNGAAVNEDNSAGISNEDTTMMYPLQRERGQRRTIIR